MAKSNSKSTNKSTGRVKPLTTRVGGQGGRLRYGEGGKVKK